MSSYTLNIKHSSSFDSDWHVLLRHNHRQKIDFIKNQFQFQFQLAALCAVSITRDHSCIGLVGVAASPGELALVVGAVTAGGMSSCLSVVVAGDAVGLCMISCFNVSVAGDGDGVRLCMISCFSVSVAGDGNGVGLCMISCLAGDVLLCVVGGVDMRRTCLCVCGGVCGGVLYSSLFALFAMVEA